MLETGVAALPTVAKLIRGVDGILQIQEFCPMRLAWNGRAFQRAGLCEKKHGAGSPRRVLSFEVSAALLQLCLCTACQVGPDHEVMKRPDRVEIGEAQGIVGMHNGCRDEQRAYWRMASEQR